MTAQLRVAVFVIVVLACLASATVSAQSVGSISGTVTSNGRMNAVVP